MSAVLATLATLASPVKYDSSVPVAFVRDKTASGKEFTRVVGVATYYLRNKLKVFCKAVWSPMEKQWLAWGPAISDDIKRELEADALKAMPLVEKHQREKQERIAKEAAGAASASAGAASASAGAPASAGASASAGAASASASASAAASVASSAPVSGFSSPGSGSIGSVGSKKRSANAAFMPLACSFCYAQDGSVCPCALAADAADAASEAKKSKVQECCASCKRPF